MAYLFPSAEWVAAFKEAINNNEAYRKSAAKWEGDFYFIVTGKGLEKPCGTPPSLHGGFRTGDGAPDADHF